MDKKLQNKLKTYSSLTAVVGLMASSADAQIIHTTVNYTGSYETYDIDIDNDGVVDTGMWAGSYGPDTYTTYYTRYCGLYGPAAKVTNSSLGYVINLASGVMVDASQPYFAIGFKNMVGTYNYVNYPSNDYSFGDPTFVGAGDKFVGVSFDISGNTHYGWLRFTNISVDGKTWTLVDMAYESTPNKGILTGDTGGASVSLKENKKAEVSVYASQSVIKINADETLYNSRVDVVNMLGQTVLTSTINNNSTTLNHSLEAGMYIVRILDNKGDAITRKVMFR